jgi:hypothetical protein
VERNGTDLRNLWILEDVGFHLQEGVPLCKRNIVRIKWARAKDERGIQRVRTLRDRVWMHHEGRKGVKDLGSGRPRYLKK